jgi:hypothetical protein
MAGTLVKHGAKALSKLSEVLQDLPEDFITATSSVYNALVKRGVKPEELEHSGMKDVLERVAKDPRGLNRLGKHELIGIDSMRSDKFARTERDLLSAAEEGHSTYTQITSKGFEDPLEAIEDFGYSENLYSFTSPKAEGFRDPHFTEATPSAQNYLMHTRTTQRPIGASAKQKYPWSAKEEVGDTHVIEEIQSFRHQKGSQEGYRVAEEVKELQVIRQQLKGFDAESKRLKEESDLLSKEVDKNITNPDIALKFYAKVDERTRLWKAASDWLRRENELIKMAPSAPLKKNWLRKAIEQEILVAKDKGLTQIAIPIKGHPGLVRGEGVQKHQYERQVPSLFKKIAKETGAEFKVLAATELPKLPKSLDNPAELLREMKEQRRFRDFLSNEYIANKKASTLEEAVEVFQQDPYNAVKIQDYRQELIESSGTQSQYILPRFALEKKVDYAILDPTKSNLDSSRYAILDFSKAKTDFYRYAVLGAPTSAATQQEEFQFPEWTK